MRRVLLAALALLAVGCGTTTVVDEPDLIVRGGEAQPPAGSPQGRQQSGGLRISSVRIAVVTHGQASDPFWAVVKRGLEDAGRQTGVAVSYRAPDTYSIARMARDVDEAVASRPDGLVVSLPDVKALKPAIERAVAAGIPVITINSGSDAFRSVGAEAHVGQPEWRAGEEGGERMGRAGVKNALCVDQEPGNAGLALRCRAFAQGLRRSGGRSRVLDVDPQEPARAQIAIAEAVTSEGIDGVMALGPTGAAPVLAAQLPTTVKLATFDLSPAVLAAVHDGRMLFAVDQQPYLQGYLPVVLLAEQAKHGIAPAAGTLIPTGPHFVTRADAAQAMQLSREGIR